MTKGGKLVPRAASVRGRAVFSWIFASLAARARLGILSALALGVLGRIGALVAAWLFVTHEPRASLFVAMATAAVFVARRIVATTARIEVERDLHVATARALLTADVLEEPDAEPHFVITNGLFAATDAAANTLPTIASDLLGGIASVVALVLLLPNRLLMAATVAAGIVGLLTLLVRARIARLHERATRAQELLGEALATVLHGRLELVASATEQGALGRVDEAGRGFVRTARRAALGGAVLGRVPIGAAIAAVVLVIALDTENGKDLIGAAVSSGVVLGAALPSVLGLVFGAQEILRLIERLSTFGKIVLRAPRPELSRAGAVTKIEDATCVAFDAVDFAYEPGGPKALSGASLGWTGGNLVLRGPNGSGKSTALRLLVGLREPDGGSISINGVDLRKLDLEAVRRRFAYLPQRSYLGEPYTTVAESFQLVAPNATAEQMKEALEQVGLARMLRRGNGEPLERPVGELSVGQRQRLGLARVLCRDADILLLDEPDANLDAEGVDRLADLINDLGRRGKKVAVAAHGPLGERLDAQVFEPEPSEPKAK